MYFTALAGLLPTTGRNVGQVGKTGLTAAGTAEIWRLCAIIPTNFKRLVFSSCFLTAQKGENIRGICSLKSDFFDFRFDYSMWPNLPLMSCPPAEKETMDWECFLIEKTQSFFF